MTDIHVHPERHTGIAVGYVICVDDRPIAIVTEHVVAERIVELLRRSGLVDVPDIPPQLPPPDMRTWAGQDVEGPL